VGAWRVGALGHSEHGSSQFTDLGLEVANLAALEAVVLAVLAEADIVAALAQPTVLFTLAAGFFQVADATEIFLRHGANCSANRAG
jgi:hypothetical protein